MCRTGVRKPKTANQDEIAYSTSSYVPPPCILSSREVCECECERAAPLMLIPSERSGKPAGGGRLGDSDRWDWITGGDLDFDDFRPRAVGNRCCGWPIRNSNDGVSSSVVVVVVIFFSRFIFEGCGPSSAALPGVDAPEPTER